MSAADNATCVPCRDGYDGLCDQADDNYDGCCCYVPEEAP